MIYTVVDKMRRSKNGIHNLHRLTSTINNQHSTKPQNVNMIFSFSFCSSQFIILFCFYHWSRSQDRPFRWILFRFILSFHFCLFRSLFAFALSTVRHSSDEYIILSFSAVFFSLLFSLFICLSDGICQFACFLLLFSVLMPHASCIEIVAAFRFCILYARRNFTRSKFFALLQLLVLKFRHNICLEPHSIHSWLFNMRWTLLLSETELCVVI